MILLLGYDVCWTLYYFSQKIGLRVITGLRYNEHRIIQRWYVCDIELHGLSNYMWESFLALLDHVRRAHEIEIRPSSVSQLSLNLIRGFLSNFGCCFPLGHALTRFLNLKKKIFRFFTIFFCSFSLTCDPMGAKISKRYSSYKS